MKNIERNLDNFLGNKNTNNRNLNIEEEGFEEVCDRNTGECKTIKSKDGLIERVNKKVITEEEKIKDPDTARSSPMIDKSASQGSRDAFANQRRITGRVRQSKLHKMVPSAAGTTVESMLKEDFVLFKNNPGSARNEIYGQNADVYQQLITVNLSENSKKRKRKLNYFHRL